MSCTRGEVQHLAYISDTEPPMEKTDPTKGGVQGEESSADKYIN